MTEKLKLKAEQSVPGYMNTVERAIYISAYIDGFEECQEENKNKFAKAKELLQFWVNDFYDGFNNSNRYEKRHKALKQSEQFLEEIEK